MVSLADLPAPVRRSLELSRIEAMVWAVMFGFGETFFLADIVRRGASAFDAALVVGLPAFVGALGSLIALWVMRSTGQRRRLVVTGALLQAGVLAFLSFTARGPLATPAVLIGAACCYQIAAQAAGTGWSSWFGDLVPKRLRGRYFAGRNRKAHFVSLVAMLTAGLVLQRLEPAGAGAADASAAPLLGLGFQVVYGVAALFRVGSAILMSRCHEPRFLGMEPFGRVRRYLAATRRGRRAWKLLLAGAFLYLTVYVASPFFGPFMLQELRFSYVEYTIATVVLVAVKVTALPRWGASIDTLGAGFVLGIAVLLIALIPVPFAFSSGLGLVLLGQTISGLGWGAFEVGHFSALLDATYKRSRPALFASMSVLNGSAQLTGVLLAAPLLGAAGSVRTLFLASASLRVLAGAGLVLILLRSRQIAPAHGTRPALRVVGFRPTGGVVTQPMLGSPAGGDDDLEIEDEAAAEAPPAA